MNDEHQQLAVTPAADNIVGPHVEIDEDECKGCGLCIFVCPPKVLEPASGLNKMGYHPARYLGSGCTGCGLCYYACPEAAAIRVWMKPTAQKKEDE